MKTTTADAHARPTAKALHASEVNLEHMHLTSIDVVLPLLGSMPRLRRLRLGHNELHDLPADMSELRLVEDMDLRGNRIAHVRDALPGLRSMPRLRTLRIDLHHPAEEAPLIVQSLPLLVQLNDRTLPQHDRHGPVHRTDAAHLPTPFRQDDEDDECDDAHRLAFRSHARAGHSSDATDPHRVTQGESVWPLGTCNNTTLPALDDADEATSSSHVNACIPQWTVDDAQRAEHMMATVCRCGESTSTRCSRAMADIQALTRRMRVTHTGRLNKGGTHISADSVTGTGMESTCSASVRTQATKKHTDAHMKSGLVQGRTTATKPLASSSTRVNLLAHDAVSSRHETHHRSLSPSSVHSTHPTPSSSCSSSSTLHTSHRRDLTHAQAALDTRRAIWQRCVTEWLHQRRTHAHAHVHNTDQSAHVQAHDDAVRALLSYAHALLCNYAQLQRATEQRYRLRMQRMQRDVRAAMTEMTAVMTHMQSPKRGSSRYTHDTRDTHHTHDAYSRKESSNVGETGLSVTVRHREGNRIAGEGTWKGSPNASASREEGLLESPPRRLSLGQLRELMRELYKRKQAHDRYVRRLGQPRETMEHYLYTFLGRRYGLRELVMSSAMAVMESVKYYARREVDVVIFGKMLRNEIDEDFGVAARDVLYDSIVQHRRLTMGGAAHTHAQTQTPSVSAEDVLSPTEWEELVRFLLDRRDAEEVVARLRRVSVLQARGGRRQGHARGRVCASLSCGSEEQEREEEEYEEGDELVRGRRVRSPGRPEAAEEEANGCCGGELCVKTLVEELLRDQLDKHERVLAPLVSAFRRYDTDGDGVVDAEQGALIARALDPSLTDEHMEVLFAAVQSAANAGEYYRMTFSDMSSCLQPVLLRLSKLYV